MPVLSDEAKELIAEAFAAADADKSGSIDAGEITTALTKVAEQEGFEPPSEEKIKKRLETLPTAKPGELTLLELTFLIGYLKVMAICTALFDAADTDGSGALGPDEIKAVIVQVHENHGADPPSDEQMNETVKEFGGEIDFDTFADFTIPIILEAFGVSIG